MLYVYLRSLEFHLRGCMMEDMVLPLALFSVNRVAYLVCANSWPNSFWPLALLASAAGLLVWIVWRPYLLTLRNYLCQRRLARRFAPLPKDQRDVENLIRRGWV